MPEMPFMEAGRVQLHMSFDDFVDIQRIVQEGKRDDRKSIANNTTVSGIANLHGLILHRGSKLESHAGGIHWK